MFILDNKTGNITLIQGDTGTISITDLPTNADRTNEFLFFAFLDSNLNIVQGSEVSVNLNNLKSEDDKEFFPEIKFFIPSYSTDKLTVARGEDYAEYYYGIKHCYTEGLNMHEDTLLLSENADASVLNTVTVYPMRVSGYTGEIDG